MTTDSKTGTIEDREDGGREEDLATARRVLAMESDGLGALAESLDGTLSAVVDALIGLSGRVVVTGMGKSGHIGRKIAATLASTGTPALYIHPGEASHGDLGMMTQADAVLALSNSGNTSELSDIIAFTRRFSIPLIAMTSRSDSVLAEQADHALLLPPVPEACPMGLAPTTSTTQMLAMGDVLAVVLLERRGFTAENFKELHPGGSLAQRLRHVGDIMHEDRELPLVHPDQPMSEALVEMTAKTFGCVGVVGADGTLIGIITDGDLRRHMNDGLLSETAEQIMTPGPKTIRAEALAAEALGVMNRHLITSLFVVENDRPIGIVSVHDCLRAGVA